MGLFIQAWHASRYAAGCAAATAQVYISTSLHSLLLLAMQLHRSVLQTGTQSLHVAKVGSGLLQHRHFKAV